MAGAYTVFGNEGTHSIPLMVKSVRDARATFSTTIKRRQAGARPACRLRFDHDDGSCGQQRHGISGARRGFQAPAAGKTGTSHDAWFAGYTSNLLCIVWVGNDDYTDIKLREAPRLRLSGRSS